MGQTEIIAGLDIGTTKTCCVLAEVDLDNGSIAILGVGISPSVGVRKGVVVDLDAATSAIRSATAKAQMMAGHVALRNVVIGVTGEHISSLNGHSVVSITSPNREVTREDVERVVEQSKVIVMPPDREIIQYIPRGYTVDGQSGIKDPVGMSATRLEVDTHIVTGAISFLDNVSRCVERAGLTIEMTVLEPIATSEAAVLTAEKDLGVALVDIGGGTTDVAVFTEGEIYYTSVLPVGGNHITRDIGVGLRAAAEEAENTKIKYGCARSDMVGKDEVFEITSLGETEPLELSRGILTQIIEPRVREILQLVKQELEKSGKYDLLPAGIVLTGGSAEMPGIVDFARDIFELPVRIGFPEDIGGLSDTVRTPKHSTAVGLVLYAAKLHLPQERTTLMQVLWAILRKWLGRR